jgi:hypothetical protein
MIEDVECGTYPLSTLSSRFYSSNYQLQFIGRQQRTSQGSRIYWASEHSLTSTHLEASSHGIHVDLRCLRRLPAVYDLDTETNT